MIGFSVAQLINAPVAVDAGKVGGVLFGAAASPDTPLRVRELLLTKDC